MYKTKQSDLNNPFLTKQLIAYIGNKRRLLTFLNDVFVELSTRKNITKFLDPFAGSGSVSRLAKFLGYQVYSNDWEEYSNVINNTYISINNSDLNSYFKDYGGIKEVLNFLNNLTFNTEPYISKFYAPKNTDNADYKTERLFYTKENAQFIDKVRNWIHENYKDANLNNIKKAERNILLSSLLYQAATHANTSGVFKACHKGFGGHGKDALKRIFKPMELQIPFLIDSDYTNYVSKMDAKEFTAKNIGDLCYLDPPYNTHQYGSNYFMLNTIARPLVI